MPEPRYEYVRIGLPLPVDVFTTIGTLLNKAWPGAQIITDAEKAGVPREFWPTRRGEQLIRVDVSRRPKAVSKKAAQDAVADNAAEPDEFVPTTSGIDKDGWVKMSAPEDLQLELGAMMKHILDSSEGAINYIEWAITDLDENRLVLSAARSKGQTPHQLRMQAEARLDAVRALLDGAPMVTQADVRRALDSETR